MVSWCLLGSHPVYQWDVGLLPWLKTEGHTCNVSWVSKSNMANSWQRKRLTKKRCLQHDAYDPVGATVGTFGLATPVVISPLFYVRHVNLISFTSHTCLSNIFLIRMIYSSAVSHVKNIINFMDHPLPRDVLL